MENNLSFTAPSGKVINYMYKFETNSNLKSAVHESPEIENFIIVTKKGNVRKVSSDFMKKIKNYKEMISRGVYTDSSCYNFDGDNFDDIPQTCCNDEASFEAQRMADVERLEKVLAEDVNNSVEMMREEHDAKLEQASVDFAEFNNTQKAKPKIYFSKWMRGFQRIGLLSIFFMAAVLVAVMPAEFDHEPFWYPILLACALGVYILIFSNIRKHWNTLIKSFDDVEDFGRMTKNYVVKWTIIPFAVVALISIVALILNHTA